MSGLKERLERLRQSSHAAEAEREEQVDHRHGSEGRTGGTAGAADDSLSPAFRQLGVREVTNEAGSFLLRQVDYPLAHRHGRYRLGDLPACASHLLPMAAQASWDGPEPEAKSLLFLDTETTGLGVGAGNLPFMIGVGSWTEGAFVVEQSLIRHPGEERAMLVWLSSKFQGITHLVTYNGKSFDWPVLESRFILNGWRRKGPAPGHLDFLHASRALWKNTLPTCRLSVVEEQRLGIVRGHDVPGALAPELYMRFLQDGDPTHLHGVFVHNELDVLTLSSLAVHFGYLLGGGLGSAIPQPVDAEERFRTGVWLERHGQAEEARRLYDMLAKEAMPDTLNEGHPHWQLELAAKFKRMGYWDRALPLWEQAAAFAEAARLPRLDAHLELAMYYEHRVKDCEAAYFYADKAMSLVMRRMNALRTSTLAAREEKERLERRLDRLKRKLDRDGHPTKGAHTWGRM